MNKNNAWVAMCETFVPGFNEKTVKEINDIGKYTLYIFQLIQIQYQIQIVPHCQSNLPSSLVKHSANFSRIEFSTGPPC